MISVKAWPLLLLQVSLVSMGKDCPFPVLNGTFILSAVSRQRNNFPDNSEAFVECSRGFEIEGGSNLINCTDGNWSLPELKCKKKDCGLPKALPHMNYSMPEGTLFGARIKPICERGYDLEGSSYSHCLVSGWSGKYKCTLIMCHEPVPIENGKFSMPRKIIQFDDVIEYSCDDNYTLVGDRSITCGQYGEYSSPPPQCKAIIIPTTASTTTNKATTTATAPATTHSNAIIIPTTASTTTNKATTTATASATTHSNERIVDELLNPSVLILTVLTIFICIICIICIINYYKKQRGANNRTAPLF